MKINLLTLFPAIFDALHYGVIGRAIEHEILSLSIYNIRDFSEDKQRRVDDRPYGGGPGMVLQPSPLALAVQAAQAQMPPSTPLIYLSPQGRRLTQVDVQKLSTRSHMTLLCGRYEGVDQRFLDHYVDEEWSIGDYILSGGEFAALTLIDAMTRLLPGVLGEAESLTQESFSQGLLDHPQYTRPELFEGKNIPEVLTSGDHQRIKRWRLKQSLGITEEKRPDLLAAYPLSPEEYVLLEEYRREAKAKE